MAWTDITLPSWLETALLGLGAFTLLGYLVTGLEFAIGNRSIRRLVEVPPLSEEDNQPSVAVIVPARNEARGIEEALKSVLSLDYHNYRVVAVNDRSEDGTGQILEAMATRYPRLKVVHVTELIPGWLGKTHAMYLGTRQAPADWYLFTDADVVFDPSVLRRAMRFQRQTGADMLVGLPQLTGGTGPLRVFLNAFTVYFSLFSRPWRARDPKSRAHIGVGAFMLVKGPVYEAIGTHQAIAMRPDDDMKLGKLLKKKGYRQEVFFGPPLIAVEWYRSIPELISGLMKNAFAGLDYNLPYMLWGISAQFLFGVWPVLALLVTEGVSWWLYAGSVLAMLTLCADNARYHRENPWHALGFPLASALIIGIIVMSTMRTLRTGGIAWRGTHYPLAALRANRI